MLEVCEKNGDECKMCDGENCNFKQSFSRCLNCNTTDNSQCAINPQMIKSKICTKYEDDCFTLIGKFIVSRGCVDEVDVNFSKCVNSKKCEICDANGRNDCNNRMIVMERCVDCDTSKDHDQSCWKNPIDHKNKICSKIDSTDREGCFLKKVCVLFF